MNSAVAPGLVSASLDHLVAGMVTAANSATVKATDHPFNRVATARQVGDFLPQLHDSSCFIEFGRGHREGESRLNYGLPLA